MGTVTVSALAQPTGLIATPQPGGSLAPGTWYAKVVAMDGGDYKSHHMHSIPSAEISFVTDATNNACSLTWTAVTGATYYNVYLYTNPAPSYLGTSSATFRLGTSNTGATCATNSYTITSATYYSPLDWFCFTNATSFPAGTTMPGGLSFDVGRVKITKMDGDCTEQEIVDAVNAAAAGHASWDGYTLALAAEFDMSGTATTAGTFHMKGGTICVLGYVANAMTNYTLKFGEEAEGGGKKAVNFHMWAWIPGMKLDGKILGYAMNCQPAYGYAAAQGSHGYCKGGYSGGGGAYYYPYKAGGKNHIFSGQVEPGDAVTDLTVLGQFYPKTAGAGAHFYRIKNISTDAPPYSGFRIETSYGGSGGWQFTDCWCSGQANIHQTGSTTKNVSFTDCDFFDTSNVQRTNNMPTVYWQANEALSVLIKRNLRLYLYYADGTPMDDITLAYCSLLAGETYLGTLYFGSIYGRAYDNETNSIVVTAQTMKHVNGQPAGIGVTGTSQTVTSIIDTYGELNVRAFGSFIGKDPGVTTTTYIKWDGFASLDGLSVVVDAEPARENVSIAPQIGFG